jgi:hypothetical protein
MHHNCFSINTGLSLSGTDKRGSWVQVDLPFGVEHAIPSATPSRSSFSSLVPSEPFEK